MNRHIDLFSGMCGFGLGLSWAGFDLVGWSEIDPFGCVVARHYFPNAKELGDVRKIESVQCDLLTGGVPCQPASIAGKRHGESDERWLWGEWIRIIRTSRPQWIIAENVPGFISVRGRGLDWYLDELGKIGYESWPLLISAQTCGAPHKRERIWIVSHTHQKRHDGRDAQTAWGRFPKPAGFLPAFAGVADTDGAGRKGSVGRRVHSAESKHEKNGQYGGPMFFNWPRGPGEVAAIPLQVDGLPGRFPGRSARIAATGNAVIPQIPYLIGRAIRQFDAAAHSV